MSESKCPECGSRNYIDTVRLESCNDCGYGFYYGDAHATGEAQRSKRLHFGQEVSRHEDAAEE
jgi:ribosomal protein L37E